MARFSDEQYEMIQDSIEKKRIARSASHKRNHCGKSGSVKFASDYMTKKELKAMNGEPVVYRMNHCMKWDEFCKMPEDLQKNYIQNIRNKYKVTSAVLSKVMGTSKSTYEKKLKKLGIKLLEGRVHNWAKTDYAKDFYDWAGIDISKEEVDCLNVDNDSHMANKIENVNSEGSVEKTMVYPINGLLNFNCDTKDDICNVLNMLKEMLCDGRVRITLQWAYKEN